MTKQIQLLTQESAAMVADALSEIFPVSDTKPVYSKGFKRWMSLSLAKKRAMWILHDFDQAACIADLEAR